MTLFTEEQKDFIIEQTTEAYQDGYDSGFEKCFDGLYKPAFSSEIEWANIANLAMVILACFFEAERRGDIGDLSAYFNRNTLPSLIEKYETKGGRGWHSEVRE